MKIEVGKYYKTRDGRKVGPISYSGGNRWFLSAEGFDGDFWYSRHNPYYGEYEGRSYTNLESNNDLVEEWKESEEMKNYNDGKWHPWTGGECPVHPKTEVEFLLSSGYKGENRAKYTKFSREAGSDIIAFRVVKEYKEPREYWLCRDRGCPFHVSEAEPTAYWSEVIHVREVLDES